jgi:hypothetical protein
MTIQIQIDALVEQLKGLIETNNVNDENIAALYRKYPDVKIGVRRAIVYAKGQILKERRQAFHKSGFLGSDDWSAFSIDENGIVDTLSGAKYQVKKSDGEYVVVKL